jgi:hypothetical protein
MLYPDPEEAVKNSNHSLQSARDDRSFGKTTCETFPSGSMGSNSRCLSKNCLHSVAMSERKVSFKASLHLLLLVAGHLNTPPSKTVGLLGNHNFAGDLKLSKLSRF